MRFDFMVVNTRSGRQNQMAHISLPDSEHMVCCKFTPRICGDGFKEIRKPERVCKRCIRVLESEGKFMLRLAGNVKKYNRKR